MPLLIRKVSYAKWKRGQPGIGADEISADAVTADLRTSQNKLSFWSCESADAEHLDKVALALATNVDKTGKVDLTWLDSAEIEKHGLSLERSPGKTPVKCLEDDHVEIVGLDLPSLGVVAEMIKASIKANKLHRVGAKKMVGQIAQAVRDGKVQIDQLEGKLRADVEEALEKPRLSLL